ERLGLVRDLESPCPLSVPWQRALARWVHCAHLLVTSRLSPSSSSPHCALLDALRSRDARRSRPSRGGFRVCFCRITIFRSRHSRWPYLGYVLSTGSAVDALLLRRRHHDI